jgi:cell division protein FtsL
MKLRSPLFALLILASLSLFFLNTWQGNRYQKLEREVQRLELEQKNWLEQNKKVIAALAVLSSPERIKTLAEESLGLKPLQAKDLIEIELGGAEID